MANPYGNLGNIRLPPARPKRQYRAGKAPEADESETESDEALEKQSLMTLGTINTINTVPTLANQADLRSVIVKEGHRGDLQSLKHPKKVSPSKSSAWRSLSEVESQPVKEKKLESGEVVVVERRRRAVAPQQANPSDVVQESKDPGDQDAHLGKRKKIEEEAPVQNELKETELPNEDADEVEGSDDESNDEVFPTGQRTKLTRPVFISESLRRNMTLAEAEELRQKADKEHVQESIKQRNQSLAIESKKERADVAEDNLSDSEVDLPNDSTEDEDISYEKWKVRELGRLKRDREERDKLFKEKEAIERRRMMTDEERAKDDKRIGKYKEEQKSDYRFMQKYYSKGVYHIDDDDPLFKRDYNIAVGEDLFDKSVLPGIKHVRRGEEHKRGKSKYTHLVAEDTTNYDPDSLPAEDIRDKFKNLTAGYKNASLFDRPSLRR